MTFGNFIHEIFNGLFNFDAKFWRTLIPLFISPGKVSKDYKEGKRSRYSNPFRFYITVSILFFLILGISISKKKFEKLTNESPSESTETATDYNNIENKALNVKEIDSIKKEVLNELDAAFIPIPEKAKAQILKEIEKEAKDTTAIKIAKGSRISFGGDSMLDKLFQHQKKYPEAKIDQALDTLGYDKNFTNRFLYTRVKKGNSLFKKENRDNYLSELLSHASISLFIFLPIFTLFLKLFYIRRKFTYVDHLIFVFHTQTVLFLLLIIITIIDIFAATDNLWIFIVIFLLYLYLAMKKFYKQGYFRTFVKFMLLNLVYFIMAGLGILLVGLLSFAFY